MPPKKKRKVAAKEPELVVGALTRLPRHAGSKVKLSLKPNNKANYAAYQNITVKIGGDTYKYSEAWSMSAKGVLSARGVEQAPLFLGRGHLVGEGWSG